MIRLQGPIRVEDRFADPPAATEHPSTGLPGRVDQAALTVDSGSLRWHRRSRASHPRNGRQRVRPSDTVGTKIRFRSVPFWPRNASRPRRRADACRRDQALCLQPDFSTMCDQPMCAQLDANGTNVMVTAQRLIASCWKVRFDAHRLIVRLIRRGFGRAIEAKHLAPQIEAKHLAPQIDTHRGPRPVRTRHRTGRGVKVLFSVCRCGQAPWMRCR